MDRPQSAPSRRVTVDPRPTDSRPPGLVRAPRPPSAGAHGRRTVEIRSSASDGCGTPPAPPILLTSEVEHVLRPSVFVNRGSRQLSIKGETAGNYYNHSPRAATSTPTGGQRLYGSKTASFGSTGIRPTSAGTQGRKVLICNAAARPSPSLGRQLEAACKNYPLVQIRPQLPQRSPTPTTTTTAIADEFLPAGSVPIDVEGITGFAKQKQEGLFKQVAETLRDEHQTYASFVNCCDASLAALKVTMEGLPTPNSVDTSVSAMLLTKLSYLVGPSYGDFMRRLLDNVFAATFTEYEKGDIHHNETVGGDASSRAGSTSAAGSSGAVGEDFYNHTILVEDNKRLAAEVGELTERLTRVGDTNARQGTMIEGVLTRFENKHLERTFHVWRKHVRESRIVDHQVMEIEVRANDKLKKTSAFLRWQRFAQWSRDQRTSALSSQTHEQLQDRVRELQQRCNTRDEEILKQRQAKERATHRANHLEEMLANLKDENSRQSGKLQETEGLTTQLLGLAGDVLGKLDESLCFLGTGEVPSSVRALSNLGGGGGGGNLGSTGHQSAQLGATTSRTFALGGDPSATNSSLSFGGGSPTLRGAGGGGGVAGVTQTGNALDGPGSLVLPHVKADGSSWKSLVLSNVREVLLAWANHVLEVAQKELEHQQNLQEKLQGIGVVLSPTTKKPSGASMGFPGPERSGTDFGSSGTAATTTTGPALAAGGSSSKMVDEDLLLSPGIIPSLIVNLKSDLSDGTFYLLVLCMLLGGGEGVSAPPNILSTDPVTGICGTGLLRCFRLLLGIDNDAERMALVVRMAKYLGLDGGLKVEDLLGVSGPGMEAGGNADNEPLVLAFVSRLFTAYTCNTVLGAGKTSSGEQISGTTGGGASPVRGGTRGGGRADGTGNGGTAHRIELPVELTHGAGAQDARYVARSGYHFFSKRYFLLCEMMKRNQEWRAVSAATDAFADRFLTKRLNGEVEDFTLVQFATVNKMFVRQVAPQETLRFSTEVSEILVAQQQEKAKAKMEASSTPSDLDPPSGPTSRRGSLSTTPSPQILMSPKPQGGLGSTALSTEELEELRTEQDDAAEFIAEEMSSCMLSWAKRLREGAYFYASCCGTLDDHNPKTLENTGWQKFLSDCRLVPRYASHKIADGIFKNHTLTPAAALAALVASGHQPPQASLAVPTTSTTTAGGKGGRKDQTVTATASKTNEVPFLDVQSAWCSVLVKLFYGKGPPVVTKNVPGEDGVVSIINTVQWPNADETVANFKKFIEGAIIPHYPLLQADHLISSFNLLTVQEVLKQYKDAVRRCFNEFAKERTATEGLRMRVEGFQLMVSKELKLLDPAETQFLFATIRQSTRGSSSSAAVVGISTSMSGSSMERGFSTFGGNSEGNDSMAFDATGRSSPGLMLGSTLRNSVSMASSVLGSPTPGLTARPGAQSQVPGAGINLVGFSMALVALSRLRFGNVLCPQSQALHLFLTNVLFPAYQHRLKLKY